MTVYIGIDPGFKGAVAILNGDSVKVIDAPVLTIGKSKREHNIPAMVRIFEEYTSQEGIFLGGVVVAIEKVHSMPRQGVASVFTFGKGFGIWLGILSTIGIPFEEVTPQRWQGVMLDGMQRGKDANRLRAMQLFPKLSSALSLKKHDGRADALLLAEYRRRIG